eukprot:gene17424-13481_t
MGKSETGSVSGSGTQSSTGSVSLTASLTLPAHDNYTTALTPSTFVEGQELRIRITARLGGRELDHFNTSDLGSLDTHPTMVC